MVRFDKLEINKCVSALDIEVTIPNEVLSFYTSLNITQVLIDTQDTVNDSMMSSEDTAIFDSSKAFSSEFYIDPTEGVKTISWSIPAAILGNIDLENNMFFVWVRLNGIPKSFDIPCRFNKSEDLGVLCDSKRIYTKGLSLLENFEKQCEPSKGFIDFILNYYALKFALLNCDYLTARNVYKHLFSCAAEQSKSKCRCNG